MFLFFMSYVLFHSPSHSAFSNFSIKSLTPTTVTNKAKPIEPKINTMLTTLSNFDVVHAFRWKRGGSMKAIGTAVRAEAISRSSEMKSYILMVRAQDSKTTSERERFLHHLRFPDFGQPPKR